MTVSSARFQSVRLMLEIPSQMLYAPLVWTDLPALINGLPDRPGALQMGAYGCSTSAREPSDQEPLCLMYRLTG